MELDADLDEALLSLAAEMKLQRDESRHWLLSETEARFLLLERRGGPYPV